MLGTAKKVSVLLNDTIILHGGGDKKLIEERCAEAPAFTIASNAGFDGALVIGKLLEQDNHNLGFDAAKGVYVDMVEERIIDPLKVVRTALVNIARICYSSPLNLSKGPLCKLSAMTKFLFPVLRTTLLLVGFSAGR
ncbi:chaperonin CPN60-like 2, mitochondrial [Quercus lobata]|uniref:chaperonin CPN60-like 2, mitochondrial n=1 Tax=Quercus lobata TaxID=97700 RepID=UPI001248DA2E|nr:chaperonin CPN60-like 2, mitochondrial [Quercus lobata]